MNFSWWKYSRDSFTEKGELHLRHCFPWKFEVSFKSGPLWHLYDHLWFLQKNYNEWKTSSLITKLLYISTPDLNEHLYIAHPFSLNLISLFLACLTILSSCTKDHRGSCRERSFIPQNTEILIVNYLLTFELWLLTLALNFSFRVSGKTFP